MGSLEDGDERIGARTEVGGRGCKCQRNKHSEWNECAKGNASHTKAEISPTHNYIHVHVRQQYDPSRRHIGRRECIRRTGEMRWRVRLGAKDVRHKEG